MKASNRQSTERVVNRYFRELQQLVKEFGLWEGDFLPGYEQIVAEPGAFLVPSTRAQELFERGIEETVRRMITGTSVVNARTWRSAASQSTQGRHILAALKREMKGSVGVRVNELIERQVAYIQGLSGDFIRRAAMIAATQQREGKRAEAIVETLEKRMPGMVKSRLKMIARTEVGRAEMALTQARAEGLGLRWYEWNTSEDSRVRPSHEKLDKVLVAFTDPPNPEQLSHERSYFGHYHPGTVPNCRCLSLPLLSVNEVRWPHKVYEHGRIHYFSRSEFERYYGMPAAA